MKVLCVFLTIALGVSLYFVIASRNREVELETSVASLKNELGGKSQELVSKDREINLERRKETNLLEQLEQLNAYGEADPRKVSATFAKTVADREVNVAIALECTSTWQCSRESAKGFPQGRSPTESRTDKRLFPAREGLLLGVRNHFAYVLVALPSELRELEMGLEGRPKPVDISVKGSVKWWSETCEYLPEQAGMELKFQIKSNQGLWDRQDWMVIHAWNHAQERNHKAPMTMMVIACENPALPAMDLLPYRNDKGWLGVVERTNVLFPVSQMNGCVSLIPTRFDREYDHNGRWEQWSGFPGSIHAVFLPVEDAPMPVLHSLIIQRTESEALWIPAWAEKSRLDAPPDLFDISAFVKIKIQTEAGPPHSVVWFTDPARRLKLRESYLTLMSRARAL